MPNDILQLQPPWLDAQCPREGRYVLGPLLGKGGMGEVVEAWDVVLCRTVALKILRNMEPTALIRFMHEAQIQARVAHPNICRIYDVDSSEGTVKIAMQLVRGPNLEQACRELSQEAVVTLVAQVAEAIHAAHGLKLIHRDLKPSNILLERAQNGRWSPFICDFGLAMVQDEPALTYSHGVMGTPAYMAPEQFQGERSQIGPSTDIYGLGGTLHFALVGHPPSGPTHGGRLLPGLTGPPGQPPSPIRESLPADLQTILSKCLEADPALRYPSAAALAEDLWRFLNGESIQATRSSRTHRLWRRVRRYFGTLATSALVLGSLLTGWILEGTYLSRTYGNRAESIRSLGLELNDLEREIRFNHLLPPHDLRPLLTRAQARLESLRSRVAALGEEGAGPGRLLLAQGYLLLGDCEKALKEATAAWQSGCQTPEAAAVLATTLARARMEPGTVQEAPEAQGVQAQRVEELFAQARSLDPSASAYPRALVAFLRRDYVAAASAARSNLAVRPWDSESASLEAISHLAGAAQHLERGDPAAAESECQQAMDGAQRFLATAPSTPALHHAWLLAGRYLAALQEDRGALGLPFLESLRKQADLALQLDPLNRDFQEDWLGTRFLLIRARAGRHESAPLELNEALVALGTRLKEPLSPGLRQARMLIQWQLAERSAARGEDPAPVLAEALRTLEPAPFLRRDFLGEVLLFKARTEAARGQDPRGTLATILGRPQTSAAGPWWQNETASEAWMLQGAWERDHGSDPLPSLKQATALSDTALQANPKSARAHALSGLARCLQCSLVPSDATVLRMVAQERLRTAQALKPEDRITLRLGEALRAGAAGLPGRLSIGTHHE